MLGKRHYAKMIERNRQVATVYLLRQAQGAKRRFPTMVPELQAAAVGGGDLVEAFANHLWPDRKSHPDDVREFLALLTADADGMVPAHRVSAWALLEHRFAIEREHEREALIERAAKCIEVRNDQERWVAEFGPISESAPDGGNPHAAFLFGSFQRMIEATLGRDVDRDDVASAVLEGSLFFSVGVEVQLDELKHKRFADFPS